MHNGLPCLHVRIIDLQFTCAVSNAILQNSGSFQSAARAEQQSGLHCLSELAVGRETKSKGLES